MQSTQPDYGVEILRLLVKSRGYYEKYYSLVAPFITSRDLQTLYGAVDHYYKTCKDHLYIGDDEFRLFVKAEYPQARNPELLELNIDCIYSPHISSDTIKVLVHKLLEQELYKEVADLCQDAVITQAYNKYEDIERKLAKFKLLLKDNEESPFAEFDFDTFVEQTKNEEGFEWRLRCLNEDIGPLPPETLGHIMARPETGKTTFLASEVTHMASQLKEGEIILWVNNEQAIGKVWQRCIAATIRAPYEVAEAQPDEAKAFLEKKNFKAIKFVDGAYISYEYLQSLAKELLPKIIIIDQGDKLHFSGDKNFEGHARLKELYRKLRELAKETKEAIITVGQASAEAEGKKWITMDMMDNSKVGKPGEMDWIIGIGKTDKDEEENLRFLHIAKNKLKGRHGKHSVVFDGAKARYLDMG
jgi:replicative DNA helicase